MRISPTTMIKGTDVVNRGAMETPYRENVSLWKCLKKNS